MGSSNADDTVLAEIMRKLDAVIVGQTELSTRLKGLEDTVGGLDRTVRGNNGTPGLVTQMALVQDTLKNCSPQMCAYFSGKNGGSRSSSTDDKEVKKQYVTWVWVVEKLFVPAVTALVLWLLFSVIPHVNAVP